VGEGSAAIVRAHLRRGVSPAAETFGGSLVDAALTAKESREDVGLAIAETFADRKRDAFSGVDLVKRGGAIGSTAGVVGACGYLLWMMYGDHGLRALKPGRIEEEAYLGAAISVGLGLATSLVGAISHRRLRKVAAAEVKAARKAALDLEDAHDGLKPARSTSEDPSEVA